jgi:hypothetical protein
MLMRRLLHSALIASAILVMAATPAAGSPDNDQTLRFELTCDDGNVYQASFNGGPSAFHLDSGGLYVWKQIWFVTPQGESGTLTRGSQGFDVGDLVTCTYIGAESGNDYTVVGFYQSR